MERQKAEGKRQKAEGKRQKAKGGERRREKCHVQGARRCAKLRRAWFMRTNSAEKSPRPYRTHDCSLSRMNKPYDIRERAFMFACDIVAFCRVVADRGYILARLAGQLVDAGGSVGANLEEAQAAQSKADFISKNRIALKEAREAHFWLRVISTSESSLAERSHPLIAECKELIAIVHTIVKNASGSNRAR
jgi:four helix bundle protein